MAVADAMYRNAVGATMRMMPGTIRNKPSKTKSGMAKAIKAMKPMMTVKMIMQDSHG
ncbi:MAG: hypothetical protein Rhob2KO_38650 [Rhodopirellula baltica]